jgi:hypothetical protein
MKRRRRSRPFAARRFPLFYLFAKRDDARDKSFRLAAQLRRNSRLAHYCAQGAETLFRLPAAFDHDIAFSVSVDRGADLATDFV